MINIKLALILVFHYFSILEHISSLSPSPLRIQSFRPHRHLRKYSAAPLFLPWIACSLDISVAEIAAISLRRTATIAAAAPPPSAPPNTTAIAATDLQLLCPQHYLSPSSGPLSCDAALLGVQSGDCEGCAKSSVRTLSS